MPSGYQLAENRMDVISVRVDGKPKNDAGGEVEDAERV
jgi:hypothetical protein